MANIEEVAAAIWALQRDTDCNDYARLSAHAKALADEMARAAIAVMRDQMQAASKAASDLYPDDPSAADEEFSVRVRQLFDDAPVETA